MRVIYTDRDDVPEANALGAQRRSFEEVLAASDFLSLHTPLTVETHHLINTDALQQMKRTAVLINTARGPVVDPGALYEALANRTIAYAALDVTEPEPIPPDSPLLTLENCLIVPHIASSTVATRGRMAMMAAENLLAGLRSEPLPFPVNEV
jgi:phosphoglycerate dehydrogenase-like enzyme